MILLLLGLTTFSLTGKSQNISREYTPAEVRKIDALQQTYIRDTISINSLTREVNDLRKAQTFSKQTIKSLNSSLEEQSVVIKENKLREASYINQLEEADKALSKLNTRLKLGRIVIPVAALGGFILGIIIAK